jgi:hypothetical protein
MLNESYKAKTVFGRPKFDLAVITSCSNVASIWALSECVQIKEVALLLQDISLTLPFPNKKLTLLL